MSFTIQRTVPVIKTYPALLGAAIKGTDEVLSVTYSVTSLVELTDSYGVAQYSVTPEGASLKGTGTIEFTYSGSGNPFEEAEEALKASLS